MRGLLIHHHRPLVAHPPAPFDRSIVPTFGPPRRLDGICRWCLRPTGTGRTVWHPTCALAYQAAKGIQRDVFNKPLIPRSPCPCGAPGEELDHRISLALAHARRDPRAILRAHLIDNLQWLCSTCHRAKTTDDRRRINNLRSHKAEDFVKNPDPADHPDQLRLFT